MIPLFDVVISPKLEPGQVVVNGRLITAGSREAVERLVSLANEAPKPPPRAPWCGCPCAGCNAGTHCNANENCGHAVGEVSP